MRWDRNNKISLDALVGILTIFELDNYDNYVPSSKGIEYAFELKSHLRKGVRNKRPVNQEVKKKKQNKF